MAPRPGGETDKVGNRYEMAWAISRALEVLAGRGKSITLEEVGGGGVGSEFTYVPLIGRDQAHQVKHQNGNSNSWSVASLASKDIWENAKLQTDLGRDYYFQSTLPAVIVHELATRCRQSEDVDNFEACWIENKKQKDAWSDLHELKVFKDKFAAWTTLRSFFIDYGSEHRIDQSNAVLCEQLFDAPTGEAAVAALTRILGHNLGIKLTAQVLEQKLAELGVNRRSTENRRTLRSRIQSLTDSWLAGVKSELLDPVISRHDTAKQALADVPEQFRWIIGTAGAGKSAVLAQIVDEARRAGDLVLAFRLDRRDPSSSTIQLGEQLGLPTSPLAALAAAAGATPAVLVIDQLDAISLLSGRIPESLDSVAELLHEAEGVPSLRVIVACRRFDLDADPRLKGLLAHSHGIEFNIAGLSDDDLRLALESMGLESSGLTEAQRSLLRLPLNLVLLASVASEPDVLDFTNAEHLLAKYWDRKRLIVERSFHDATFSTMTGAVARAISDSQHLSVPESHLDDLISGRDMALLLSEHVLVRDDTRIAFFHETLFDYAFARFWTNRREDIVDFLTSGEQELFRRGQVRQILTHLRSDDFARYLASCASLLKSPVIRLHLKDLTVSFLSALAEPTADELFLLQEVSAVDETVAGVILRRVRGAPWFRLYRDLGLLSSWLISANEAERTRAFDLTLSAARADPDAVAAVLAHHRAVRDYQELLRHACRAARLWESRQLLNLLLEAVASGMFEGTDQELWQDCYGLASKEPRWAVDILRTRLTLAATGTSAEQIELTVLKASDHAAQELVTQSSEGAPDYFAEQLLPYFRRVLDSTAIEHQGAEKRLDGQYAFLMTRPRAQHNLGEALLIGLSDALTRAAKTDWAAVAPALSDLAESPLAMATWLVYDVVIRSEAPDPEWAAALVHGSRAYLDCHLSTDTAWQVRSVISVIADRVADTTHRDIEDYVRDYRRKHEKLPRAGFVLLSGLDEAKLSDIGKRRLAEYHRALGPEPPIESPRMVSGFIQSPVPEAALPHMTDDNWLAAIQKYQSDSHGNTFLKGGANELASSLGAETKRDPARFAKLALRFTSETNPVYGSSILMALHDESLEIGADVVFAAVRHLASLGPGYDRWLGWALSKHYREVPADLVELLLDRALHSPDPQADREDSERDLRAHGLNSARGSLAESLGDLLLYDADGTNAHIVAPHLGSLAADPVLAVRSCVAHTIAASLAPAPGEALRAFDILFDADDRLLGASLPGRLIRYMMNVDWDRASSMLDRMLRSSSEAVQANAGQLAAVAAFDFGHPEHLQAALAGQNDQAMTGVARVASDRLLSTERQQLARETLKTLMNNDSAEVRLAASGFVADLRNSHLLPHRVLLGSLISSRSFGEALGQLLLTLESALDRMDALVLATVDRFIQEFRDEAGDIRTSAAGDAGEISTLIVTALAHSNSSAVRAGLLDSLDSLVRIGAFGVDEAIDAAGR